MQSRFFIRIDWLHWDDNCPNSLVRQKEGAQAEEKEEAIIKIVEYTNAVLFQNEYFHENRIFIYFYYIYFSRKT